MKNDSVQNMETVGMMMYRNAVLRQNVRERVKEIFTAYIAAKDEYGRHSEIDTKNFQAVCRGIMQAALIFDDADTVDYTSSLMRAGTSSVNFVYY